MNSFNCFWAWVADSYFLISGFHSLQCSLQSSLQTRGWLPECCTLSRIVPQIAFPSFSVHKGARADRTVSTITSGHISKMYLKLQSDLSLGYWYFAFILKHQVIVNMVKASTSKLHLFSLMHSLSRLYSVTPGKKKRNSKDDTWI